MEFIIFLIIQNLLILLLHTNFKIKLKEILKIGKENSELDNIVKKYPSNIEICKKILKKLKNEDVEIKEDKNAHNSLYIAISNKIIIANMKESFTRIQTICHECLHSVQDKKIQKFNFVYANFYILYFIVFAILTIFGKIQNGMTYLAIYVLLGYVYFFIRSYLENDAMIKAKFLAKEYMEEEGISSKEEIDRVINEYEKLNTMGIKYVNFKIFTATVIKVEILTLLMYFFQK